MSQLRPNKVQRQKQRREEYIKKGLCIACGKPSVTKRHCEYHRRQHNTYSLQINNARRGVYHLMRNKTHTYCGLYVGKGYEPTWVRKPKRCCKSCRKLKRSR